MKYLILLATVLILGTTLLIKSERVGLKEAPKAQTSPKVPEQLAPEKHTRFLETYEDALAYKKGKALVVFGAEWCHYCVSLKEHLKTAAPEGCVICIVDIDDRKDLKSKHSVRTLPTSLVFGEGKEISRKVGFSKAEYGAWLNKVLKQRNSK